MTREQIKNQLYTDLEFIVNGKGAAFCPIGVYVVGYDKKGKEFETLDEAMDAKVFDGQSLVDVWDQIYPQIS